MSLNAENEVSFSISDAQGRSLMSGILHPHDAVAPNTPGALLTWSCNVPDTTETINSKIYLTSLSVDALGNTSKSRSNALGHTVQSVDQGGNISTVQYDAGGNAIVSRDPNNVGRDCVYDQLGRRTSCTDTVGSVTQTGYDKAGQQITATDAKNKVTHYAFDARGRRWKETDRLTYPTEWSYDPSGNLLSLKDAENQITAYGYNDAGQRVTEKYPDHVTGATLGTAGYGIITFGYDALGRRVSKQDQQGDITSYNFDKSGRMLTRGYVGYASSLSPLSGQTNTDTFTYDRAGRMLSGIKGRYNNTITFSYDDRGQQTQETLTTHGQTYTVGYQKNTLGQTTQLVYPDGSLVNRAYTNRGQLQAVSYTPLGGALSSVATFTYDPGGRETQRNLGNGLTTSRSYFADNQIQTIATPTVETLTYTYDPNKNPTSESRSGVMAPYSWTTGPAGYDDEDRLKNWSRTNGEAQSWNLSPVHDWNSFTSNGAVQTRTHGPAHEILTMAGAAVTSSPRTLQHDTKGNMTLDDRGTGMAWDFDNMLQTFTANGVSGLSNATYEYDAIGRRVAKNVAQSGGGTQTTLFVQAGQQVTCEYSLGNAVTDCDRKYAYGTYIDEVLNFIDATAASEVRYWLHQNYQFHAYCRTTLIGQVSELLCYPTFCKRVRLSATGSPLQEDFGSLVRIGFTGRTLDEESGLWFFRSRMLASTVVEFLTRDVLQRASGRNPYSIEFRLRGTDPSGYLRQHDIDMAIGCAGSKVPETKGNILDGSLSEQSTTGCANEILENAFSNYVIDKFEETMEEVIKAMLKQSGVPGIDKLLLTNEVLQAIADILNGDTEGGADVAKDALKKLLLEHLPDIPKDLLDPLIDDIWDKTKGKLKGSCAAVDLTWKNTAHQSPLGDPYSDHSVECNLVVCRHGKDWSVEGCCDYKCSGAGKCCCGSQLHFCTKQSGTRSLFGNCTGTKPAITF